MSHPALSACRQLCFLFTDEILEWFYMSATRISQNVSNKHGQVIQMHWCLDTPSPAIFPWILEAEFGPLGDLYHVLID